MPAANHEDQLLPAACRDAREVVVEAADGLEVDVELQVGHRVPFVSTRHHANRPYRRSISAAIYIQERLESGRHLRAADPNRRRRERRAPAERSCSSAPASRPVSACSTSAADPAGSPSRQRARWLQTATVAKLEREKGFEPTTLCSRFADRRSAVLLERKLQ